MNAGEERLYGEQTVKALEAFGYGPLPRDFIRAMGQVKKAAVLAHYDSQAPYPEDFKPFLIEALDEIIEGALDDQFPLSLKTGSAGTSLHFNLNEVAAARANVLAAESGHVFRVHPTDHLNAYQSTNDVVTTALTVLMVNGVFRIEEELIGLQECLVESEARYDGVLVTGRTEMQDALPMKLGQVFASWAGPVERDRWRFNKLKDRCRLISLGGTAVGTCFSAPREYVFAAEKHLRNITGLPLSRSQNLTDAVANADTACEYMLHLKLCADSLFKICGDILLYTSSFLSEMEHPRVLHGSTIMASKSNPVLLEFVRGLALDVTGEEAKVAAYTRNGQLQLNAYVPFIIHSVITSTDSLIKALSALRTRLFPSLVMHTEKMNAHLYASPALLNALRPWISYTELKKVSERMDELRADGKAPSDRNEWEAFIIKETALSDSFVKEFLDMPALTGYLPQTLLAGQPTNLPEVSADE